MSKSPPGCLHQFLHCVSVRFAFQLFYGNDVTCLTGIIAIIDPNLLDLHYDYTERLTKTPKRLERYAFLNESS